MSGRELTHKLANRGNPVSALGTHEGINIHNPETGILRAFCREKQFGVEAILYVPSLVNENDFKSVTALRSSVEGVFNLDDGENVGLVQALPGGLRDC